MDDSNIVSDSDTDNEEAPNAYFQTSYQSFNETAESLKEKIDLDKKEFVQIDQIISQFYHTQLVRYDRPEKLQENKNVFGSLRRHIQYFPPNPPLYFLPSTILVKKKINLCQIRDKIIDFYKQNCQASITPNKKSGNKLFVTIHNKHGLSYYIIKTIPVQLNRQYSNIHCFDHSLVLNSLIEYYRLNYDKVMKFSETLGLFLYWAYQRQLLNEDYLSEETIKLLTICFFCSLGAGVENIIRTFQKRKKIEMQKMKKMFIINKKMEFVLDDDLFEDQIGFALRQEKGLKLNAQKKHTVIKQILPIPYPIFPEKQPKKQEEIKALKKSNEYYCSYHFILLLYYLNSSNKRSNRVKIDFTNNRLIKSEDPSEFGFILEVMHPVFEYNICEEIKTDSLKMKRLKYEIQKAVGCFQSQMSPIDGFKEILTKK